MIKSILPALALAGFSAAQVNPTSIYPSSLNDTTNFGIGGSFYIQVVSNEPTFNGHNVQLRKKEGCDDLIAGIGNTTDPVATFRLSEGEILYTAPDVNGELRDAGPIGGLRNITGYLETSYQEFIFETKNQTNPAPTTDFLNSSTNWYLTGSLATYRLFQEKVPELVVNGFILCSDKQDPSSADFWYLVYGEGASSAGDQAAPYCAYIGLQVILPYSEGQYITNPS